MVSDLLRWALPLLCFCRIVKLPCFATWAPTELSCGILLLRLSESVMPTVAERTRVLETRGLSYYDTLRINPVVGTGYDGPEEILEL
ncbi:hypothetical protein HOY82DRAFT_555235 [Tuber indicum]|nr:hypothetical protein HOY82DRAFT_555235 [Tuber indicum]